MAKNELFSKYKSGMIVDMSLVSRNLNLSLEDTYRLCESRSDLKSFLFIKCPKCKLFVNNTRYKTIGEVPESITCNCCGNVVSETLINSYVFYEKIESSE